jgi:hypothetical protein
VKLRDKSNRTSRFVCWVVGVFLALAACNASTQQPATPPTLPTASPPGDDVNVLIAVEGTVRLTRWAWSEPQAVGLGTVLQRGDLLEIGTGSKAAVLCDDLSLWIVPAAKPQGIQAGCPSSAEPDLMRVEGQLGRTRGVPTTIPYILSPRLTNILTDRPLLRWHEVTGVLTYTVHVQGRNLDWTDTVANASAVEYPGQPPLKPGVPYKLVVEAAGGRSSEDEGVPNLGFYLLSQEEQAAIEADIYNISQTIKSHDLPETARMLSLAYYYTGQESNNRLLLADAITQLESLVKEVDAEPAVFLFLASLYQSAGLVSEADVTYRRALAAAKAAGNLEVQAQSKFGLAELHQSDARPEAQADVHAWVEEGIAHHEQLGDLAKAEQLLQRWSDFIHSTPITP